MPIKKEDAAKAEDDSMKKKCRTCGDTGIDPDKDPSRDPSVLCKCVKK